MPVAALSKAYGAQFNYFEPSTVVEETAAGILHCSYLTPEARHFLDITFATDGDAANSFDYYTKSGHPPLRVPGFSVEAYRVLVPGETEDEPLHLVTVPSRPMWYSYRLAEYAGNRTTTPEGSFEQYSAIGRALVDAKPHPPNIP